MRFRVSLVEAAGTSELEVDLPALRPGEPVRARAGGREVEVVLLAGPDGETALSIDGVRHPLREISSPGSPGEGTEVRFLHRGWPIVARVESELDLLRAGSARRGGSTGPFTLASPLPGIIRRVLASPGDEVEEDTPLLTLEAMKMENEVRAGRRGRLAEVLVRPGQVVNGGEPLARIR